MTRAAPGLSAALAAVGIAFLVHLVLPAVPLLTLCVALGMIVAQIPAARGTADGMLRPGLTIASKRLMRVGIALLGLQLVFADVLGLGWITVVAVVGVTAVSFAGTYLIARLLGLPGNEPILLAAGFSICGASAIGAMAAVTRSSAREQSRPVALVTLCGTLAIVVLPLAGTALGLTVPQYGRWAGASVHDVGQVVATAQEWGGAALAIAIVVKLLRVLLLAPLTAGAGVVLRMRGASTREQRPPLVPLFVVAFVVAVATRSLVPIPAELLTAATVLQSVLLGMALFALGTGIRFAEFAKTGGRTAIAGFASWTLIGVLSLFAVAL